VPSVFQKFESPPLTGLLVFREMGKILEEKQKAGEIARAGDRKYTSREYLKLTLDDVAK